MQFKSLFKKHSAVVGSWINTASPIVAELMSGCGFDFLTIDVEHSAVDLMHTQSLFQAIQSGNPNCAPFVRLQGNDYAENKRYLDAGAKGVIAPLINTPEQAMELVRSVKYPPEGERGVGFCRANAYGAHLQEVVESANQEIFICVQIEHALAVENIDAILAVSGIDGVMIGPYDLSASMGITGQFDHSDMVSARETVLSACEQHGVTAGIHVVQPDVDEVIKRIDEGYRFIAYSLDITMLLSHFADDMKRIKETMGENE